MSTPQYPTDPQWQSGQDPNYPTQPGYPPQQPSYPQQPNYPQPAYPSQPLYPQYGEQQPGYPPQQGFGYGAPPSQYPGQPPYGGPPQPPKPNRVPLIIGIVAAVVLLCVVLPGAFIAISALRGVSNIGQAVRDAEATQTAEAASQTGPEATQTAAALDQTIYENPMDGSHIDWSNNDHCAFKADGYHIIGNFICFAPPSDVSDATITVVVKQASGVSNKFHGIVFRRASKGNYYAFEIDANGSWSFFAVKSDTPVSIVDVTQNPAIVKGLSVMNTMQVNAVGSHFVFSVNGTQIGQADDSSFTSGLMGLDGDDGADVVYTNFKATQPSA